MPGKVCTVMALDARGLPCSVQLEAGSLFEAAAAGLEQLHNSGCLITQLQITVVVRQKAIRAKVAMRQYVHTDGGGHPAGEWRQCFQHPTPFEETDIACPGSGAFSIHGSSENKKTAFASDGGRSE